MSRGLRLSAHDHRQDDPVRSQLTRGLLRLEIRGSWCMPVPKVIGPRLRQWVSSMARGSCPRGRRARPILAIAYALDPKDKDLIPAPRGYPAPRGQTEFCSPHSRWGQTEFLV